MVELNCVSLVPKELETPIDFVKFYETIPAELFTKFSKLIEYKFVNYTSSYIKMLAEAPGHRHFFAFKNGVLEGVLSYEVIIKTVQKGKRIVKNS